MRSRSLRPWSIAALGAVAVCQGLGGCGTSSGAAGLGEACSVATDCAPGLVCVVQKNGGRICSDDLSSVLGKPPASNDGDGGDVEPDDAGDRDSGTGEGDGATPGEPDAASPDAGSPKDAGEPEPDASEPEPDAGHVDDAGNETPDADPGG